MAAEEPKPATEPLPEFKKISDKLDNESTTHYTNQFDKMVHSPEWSINGYTFHYQIQSFKKIKARKELEKEDIDENKDPDGYAQNYFKRGMILIKEGDLTEKIFEDIDFYDFENLITAWGVRARRGFPRNEQSVPVVV